MKITELIERLQAELESKGDLEVVINYSHCHAPVEFVSAEVHKFIPVVVLD